MGKMTCEECRRWWSPYLDSELEASTTFEVSEHLRGCAACRDRFEAESHVDQWMRARLREERVPPELWASVCDKVRERPSSVRFPMLGSLAVAASMALLAAGGVYYLRLRPEAGGSSARNTPGIVVAGPSVADLLHDASPQLAAFEEPAAETAGELPTISRRILGHAVRIEPVPGGHPLEIVDVQERTDTAGGSYLEVRLNCCGHPVLVAISRADCETCIAELKKVTDDCATTRSCKLDEGTGEFEDRSIRLRSIERSGVMIAAAAAGHTVSGVLQSIRIEPA